MVRGINQTKRHESCTKMFIDDMSVKSIFQIIIIGSILTMLQGSNLRKFILVIFNISRARE